MTQSTNIPSQQIFGVVAQFKGAKSLLHAAEKVTAEGYKCYDTYSPFPVHGMDSAMGLKRSKIPWIVFVAGMTGLGLALLMQWWMNGVEYPFEIAGKPIVSYQSYVPVAFEVIILLSALTTLLCLFGFTKLPQPYHPLFKNPHFRSVSTDGFFLAIEHKDPLFDEQKAKLFLASCGGYNVSTVYEES